MGPSRFTRIAVAVGTAAGFLACADGSAPSRFVAPGANLGTIPVNPVGDGDADGERIEVCKVYVGTPGPDVDFHVVGPGVDHTVSLGHNECANVFLHGGSVETATITETVPAGYTASYVRETLVSGVLTIDNEVQGNQATADAGGSPVTGSIVRFYNTLIPVDEGCTYTQGYWKTHSSYGPAGPEDDGWANVGGPDAAFFSSGKTWIQMFQTPVKGDVYVQLAHQYMAAKLNVLNGATPTAAVTQALLDAEAYFGGGAYPVGAHSILGEFNEGLIGPGHCDDTISS